MKNKIAFVTGSTSGIGLGIAKYLASKGFNLIINGFGDENLISEIKQNLLNLGSKHVEHDNTDLTKSADIKAIFNKIRDQYGVLDILINNAGMQFVSSLEDFPEEKLEKIIQLDLMAAFYTTKYAIPLMKKNKWGRIINIASAHALVASPFKAPYVAAKHGLLGMTKAVALELAQENITVNAICPGYVETPLVLGQVESTAKLRNITPEEVIKNVMLGPQATKKFVQIEEIAALVGFLCSDDSKSITGTGISIDGGWTSQ
jgi:3-hydroxybutyrate dehydrogenase